MGRPRKYIASVVYDGTWDDTIDIRDGTLTGSGEIDGKAYKTFVFNTQRKRSLGKLCLIRAVAGTKFCDIIDEDPVSAGLSLPAFSWPTSLKKPKKEKRPRVFGEKVWPPEYGT